ncbi:MAG: cytochrome d ubiquinol oxidase subunit II [Armatimonadaceae bacterium]
MNLPIDFHILWFFLIGVLLFGYAVLDGFDLGVGILYPLAKGDNEKRTMLNAIGPLWDGNEVWLVTFGGALFACFPDAYATIFSGFYLAFMLLLCCLIFRAISIEFRGKIDSKRWRGFFDFMFFASSTTAALLFGVATGNMLIGIPVGADKEFAGTFLGLLRPYPLLVGVFVVALFAMHGSLFLHSKTEGELQERIKPWMWTSFGLFMVMFFFVTMATLVFYPHVIANFRNMPLAWIVPVLNVLAIANIPRALYLGKPTYGFISSCVTVASLVFLLGMALFPNLVPSSMDPAYSLTIYNASSSVTTLRTAALIALLGMPMVLTYTATIYWVFRGKVKLGEFSY